MVPEETARGESCYIGVPQGITQGWDLDLDLGQKDPGEVGSVKLKSTETYKQGRRNIGKFVNL